jgi:hypothetical protein
MTLSVNLAKNRNICSQILAFLRVHYMESVLHTVYSIYAPKLWSKICERCPQLGGASQYIQHANPIVPFRSRQKREIARLADRYR